MTVCMYRDIHTLQPYIIDFTQRGCDTLRSITLVSAFTIPDSAATRRFGISGRLLTTASVSIRLVH